MDTQRQKNEFSSGNLPNFWASISPYVKEEVISALPYRDIIRIKHVTI